MKTDKKVARKGQQKRLEVGEPGYAAMKALRKEKSGKTKNITVVGEMMDKATNPWAVTGIALISLVFAVILTDRWVIPTINSVEFDLGEPMPFIGSLQANNRLQSAKKYLDDQVYGPECLAINEDTGLVYAGLKTGLIVEIKMDGKKATILRSVRLVNDASCDGTYETFPLCGRPLGIRFNFYGELVVVDAYLGIYVINFEDESTLKIVSTGDLPTNNENAPPVRYMNDVDFLPDGRLVITESSTKFDDRDCILDMFEHRPNGRILTYDPRKKDLRVLMDGLYFPNGIQVNIEKGAASRAPFRVFFSEMGMTRIMTVWVPQDPYSTAPLKTEVLIDKLPGYPDNIRSAKDSSHLLVPIPVLRESMDNVLEGFPRVRDNLAKIFTPKLLDLICSWFSNQKGLVLMVNTQTGEIIQSYQDQSGTITAVSTAIDDGKGGMYLGSDKSYYIAHVPM